MRFFPAVVGLTLAGFLSAGCSLGDFNPPPAAGFNEPDVPSLAAMSGKIQEIFKTAKLTGYPRVSGVRRAPVTAPADWMVCLRNDVENDPRTYALFIQGREVIDFRLAVLIDQCPNDTYGPLPTAMPVK